MTESNGLLTGRTALVTGASRGIGLAIAQRFAAEGAAVAVTARTVEPGDNPMEGSLTETVAKIADAGGQVVAIAADLSRPEERARLVLETQATLGRVDILVNNAAATWYMPVADFTPKRRELMFQLQVYAADGPRPAGPSIDGGRRPRLDPQHLLGSLTPPRRPAWRSMARRRGRLRHVQGGS